MPEGTGPLTLSARAEPEAVEAVQDLLDQLFAGTPDLDVQDRVRFEVAVVEIAGNIVEHAFSLDGAPTDASGRHLEVELEASSTRLEARLSDNGLPAELDLSRVTMPDAEAESGRGLALALRALDDLTYDRERGRNRWTLVCLRRLTPDR
jgi:serine/threonine-protein kinase RsbW